MEYVFGGLIYIGILIYCRIKDKQYEQQRKKQPKGYFFFDLINQDRHLGRIKPAGWQANLLMLTRAEHLVGLSRVLGWLGHSRPK